MALYGKIKAKLVGKPFCTMVVLAAGSSKRMGRDKLMMEVGGVPVLVRSLQAMQNCSAVDELIVVTRMSRLEEIAALRDRYGLTKMTKVVVGGMTRAESSLAGVLAASGKATLIGIHDAARPLVTDAIITETIQAAKKSRAAAPGIPVRDTVKLTAGGVITGTPERSRSPPFRRRRCSKRISSRPHSRMPCASTWPSRMTARPWSSCASSRS